MESRGGHAQRREDAYRHAAAMDRRADRLEADAVLFFNALGDADAASRHACNAMRQGELADADDARAVAASNV
jgi:hypothetical protein